MILLHSLFRSRFLVRLLIGIFSLSLVSSVSASSANYSISIDDLESISGSAAAYSLTETIELSPAADSSADPSVSPTPYPSSPVPSLSPLYSHSFSHLLPSDCIYHTLFSFRLQYDYVLKLDLPPDFPHPNPLRKNTIRFNQLHYLMLIRHGSAASAILEVYRLHSYQGSPFTNLSYSLTTPYRALQLSLPSSIYSPSASDSLLFHSSLLSSTEFVFFYGTSRGLHALSLRHSFNRSSITQLSELANANWNELTFDDGTIIIADTLMSIQYNKITQQNGGESNGETNENNAHNTELSSLSPSSSASYPSYPRSIDLARSGLPISGLVFAHKRIYTPIVCHSNGYITVFTSFNPQNTPNPSISPIRAHYPLGNSTCLAFTSQNQGEPTSSPSEHYFAATESGISMGKVLNPPKSPKEGSKFCRFDISSDSAGTEMGTIEFLHLERISRQHLYAATDQDYLLVISLRPSFMTSRRICHIERRLDLSAGLKDQMENSPRPGKWRFATQFNHFLVWNQRILYVFNVSNPVEPKLVHQVNFVDPIRGLALEILSFATNSGSTTHFRATSLYLSLMQEPVDHSLSTAPLFHLYRILLPFEYPSAPQSFSYRLPLLLGGIAFFVFYRWLSSKQKGKRRGKLTQQEMKELEMKMREFGQFPGVGGATRGRMDASGYRSVTAGSSRRSQGLSSSSYRSGALGSKFQEIIRAKKRELRSKLLREMELAMRNSGEWAEPGQNEAERLSAIQDRLKGLEEDIVGGDEELARDWEDERAEMAAQAQIQQAQRFEDISRHLQDFNQQLSEENGNMMEDEPDFRGDQPIAPEEDDGDAELPGIFPGIESLTQADLEDDAQPAVESDLELVDSD